MNLPPFNIDKNGIWNACLQDDGWKKLQARVYLFIKVPWPLYFCAKNIDKDRNENAPSFPNPS